MVRAWLAAPRRWLWSFVLLLLLPAAAVAWLGVELVRKDRKIEARNAEDQREILASRLLADIERLVSASERTLANAPRDLALTSADDAVVIDIEGDRVGPRPPSTLLYRPRLAHSLVDDTSPFEAAEILELRDKNVDAAIAAYRTLSLSSDRYVRAGALLRLARTLRTAGRGDDALRVYAELERHGTTRLDGLPADLVARHLSASLLHDLGHRGLTRAATSLLEDLFVPRWTLDQATFELYRDELSVWLGRIDTPPTGAEVLAETVDWFWHEAQRSSIQANDRRTVEIRGQGMTLLWQSAGDRLTVLVAGPRFRQRRWVEPVIGRPEYQGMGLTALTPGSEPAATALDGLRIKRSPDQTGLPWISVVTSSVVTDMSALAPKRRTTLLAGLTLLLAVVLTAAYVMARSVARELAVARLQSDFVAAVSHEFRTPLTSLHQFIELLDEEEEPPPDKRRAFYRAQSRAAGRLTQLVESLLDFGRMEAGVHPFRMETLTVASLAREVIREFQRDGTLDEFSFDFEVGPGEDLVWADREAVSRALRNLLENAVKYSGDSRRVTVGVRREQDAVAISVRDWGLGIPRDEQQEIFKKFVRGSASRVNGIPGTGIGLAMVRYIADVHRGRVVVESAIGHGSTFTIFLPATVPAGAPVVTSTTERQDIGSPESWHAS